VIKDGKLQRLKGKNVKPQYLMLTSINFFKLDKDVGNFILWLF